MKKGFTVIEVSILFVIFMIVAFLVAPLALDDTIQARNTSRWRSVQADFMNIHKSIDTYINDETLTFESAFETLIKSEFKGQVKRYKISTLNGSNLNSLYDFEKFYTTYSNSVIAYKVLEKKEFGPNIMLIYDVNGTQAPNAWGKDVFGYNIFMDKIEPFGKEQAIAEQKKDCSRFGTGLYCSNYYLIGGNFD